MRHTPLLLPALLALTVTACARQQPAYYVTDSATGRRITTAQQGAPERERGLFTSTGLFTSSTPWARGYADVQPQSRPKTNRGLFGARSDTPTHTYLAPAPQIYPPQSYSYRPPRQQAAMPPSSTMQYRPPQPTHHAYGPPPMTMRYRSPQPVQQAYARQLDRAPQPAGYDAERYGWY
jgi:hypothetical protein